MAVIQGFHCIRKYFLTENEILDDPTKLFNCDETGMPFNPKPLKTVCKLGAKDLSYITGNSNVQISVLVCSSAARYALPLYVVFDRKTQNQELTRSEVPGTVYGLSSNGWMDTELFKYWFMDHFLKYVPSSRPLLLLMGRTLLPLLPRNDKAAAEELCFLHSLLIQLIYVNRWRRDHLLR